MIALTRRLQTHTIGRAVHYHRRIDSTNAEAMRLAAGGARDGTVVLAHEQVEGRGRHGRTWESPAAGGVWVSILLRPPAGVAPWTTQPVTLGAGVAAAEAIREETGLQVGLAWPNDVVVGGRKLGGILAEVAGDGAALVVGAGLNTNLDPHDLPPAVAGIATSIRTETGERVRNLDLLVAFLNRLDGIVQDLRAGRAEPILARYRALSATLGERVLVRLSGREEAGLALDVTPAGGLRLRRRDGSETTVLAGEVLRASR